MTRGFLSDSELQAIHDRLPSLEPLETLIHPLSPEFLSPFLPHDSWIPVAAVCVEDAYHAIAEARYAMHESIAHHIWYLQKKEHPDEMTAVHFAKYYVDDCALRLYSAAEHLANAIVHMLELSPSEVREFKEGKGSLQSALGQYLQRRIPEHELTRGAMKLASSKDWALAITYRNDWVHNKPPMVAGLGINYERKRRWVQNEDERSWTIGIGGGDEPTHQVETLQESFIKALAGLMDFAVLCAETYQEMLSQKGFHFEDGRLRIRFGGSFSEGTMPDD